MRLHRTLVAAWLLAALVACAGDRPAADALQPTSAASDCPPGSDPLADWVAFVQHAGVHYEQAWPLATVPEDQLGPVVATVTCMRSTSTRGAREPVRDGDAAFLPAGTELRTLTGVDPDLRLAAQVEGGWEVYDAHDVPGARTGAELLDLREVVRVSLVESYHGTGVVRTVDTAADVARLVAAVRSAPVVTEAEAHQAVRGPLWFVRFELARGPVVQRAWYPDGRVLFPRVEAPPELRELLLP